MWSLQSLGCGILVAAPVLSALAAQAQGLPQAQGEARGLVGRDNAGSFVLSNVYVVNQEQPATDMSISLQVFDSATPESSANCNVQTNHTGATLAKPDLDCQPATYAVRIATADSWNPTKFTVNIQHK